ncbi:MAG TPA: ribonuclease P protein component [Microlunatus sp.]
MLPRDARMRRSEDFRRTVRHGVRAGRRTVVVHALQVDAERDMNDPDVNHPDANDTGANDTGASGHRIGFVVSKAVGSAVCRNRVRRRLRHLARVQLPGLPIRTLVVVRALPPSASAGPELGRDLEAAWAAALARLARR